jgi:26S proteasome regulatory subunit N8
VKVHPIALLSIVDHYERAVGNKANKRVLGVVLGEVIGGVYEVTNAYAIPFDENTKQPGVWFVDNVYHEEMYSMF